MVYTLDALQRSKDVILNAMDVFVNEPLIDWQKLARRLASQQKGGEGMLFTHQYNLPSHH